MLKFLIKRMLDAHTRRYGGDASYLYAMYAASPRAFGKIAKLSALATHREAVTIEAYHAARLIGAVAEDCGPCVQIEVILAREAQMNDAQIEAVLSADTTAMSADTLLGFNFAKSIVARAADQEAARQSVRTRWGEKGIIDLTLALQVSRMFPMIKQGLGVATACQRISIGEKTVPVARPAA